MERDDESRKQITGKQNNRKVNETKNCFFEEINDLDKVSVG